jgi:hypothetical protein
MGENTGVAANGLTNKTLIPTITKDDPRRTCRMSLHVYVVARRDVEV